MGSVIAAAADLLGVDPRLESSAPARPTVAEAMAELAPGQVVAARSAEGHDLAVYAALDGQSYAVPDSCPHDGGPLSSGFVDGRSLVCARHGWEFDVATGECPRARGRSCSRPVPLGRARKTPGGA